MTNEHYFFKLNFQEEECEIEVIEYTTTTSSKTEVTGGSKSSSKAPIISGEVTTGSRIKQSEVRHLDLESDAYPCATVW